MAVRMLSWEIREEGGINWSVSAVRVEDISFRYSEGLGGVDKGFHRFLKKDRKGEKLFVFIWFGGEGGVILVSEDRIDLFWNRFSVIRARGEELSILVSDLDVICEPNCLFRQICCSWC